MNDWRITNQEEYLFGKSFALGQIATNDHEHCEFCWKKFNIGDLQQGYSTLDDYYVVCKECFDDFKDMFKFRIFDKKNFEKRKISDIFADELVDLIDGKRIYRFKRVEALLQRISGIMLYKERVTIVPCLVTSYINKPIKIEKRAHLKINIETGTADELYQKIKHFRELEKDMKKKSMNGASEFLALNFT